MLHMIPHLELFLRLFIAAALGGCIGFERERKSWVAGLRTHMLVCVGAALIMIVSQYGFMEVIVEDLIVLDPSRVAAQAVSGIGFLGAGTILFWKERIRGLTTAASLWAVAAVGLAIGGGLYSAGIFTTLIGLVILAGLKPIEKRYLKSQQIREIRFTTQPGIISLITIHEILAKFNLTLEASKVEAEVVQDKEIYRILFEGGSLSSAVQVMEEIKKIAGIEKIELI